MTGRPVALVLRALYLGDLLTGLPALTLLRRALPEHHIVLAAPAAVGDLARWSGSIDALTPAAELSPLDAAPRGADVAIDLHGSGPASRDLLAATRPRRLVAYHGGHHDWRADEHEVSRWCRLVGEAFDVGPPWPGVSGLLPVPPAGSDAAGPAGRTVVHPGAKAAARRWPARRYVRVAAELARAGHDVVVTGGPGEEKLAADIARAAGVPALTGLSLPDLLVLIARARLVVCGDTGIAHVASAYRTPSVVLFGPVPPAQWGPPPEPRHRVLWPAPPEYRGDPLGERPDPVLISISVEDVLTACALALDPTAQAGAPRSV